MPTKLTLAHELDAAWIIALWKAIHGGDPTPIEVDARAAELISELANHLGHTIGHGAAPLTLHAFEARIQALGLQMDHHEGSGERAGLVRPAEGWERPPYCFTFEGQTICVYFPRHVFTLE